MNVCPHCGKKDCVPSVVFANAENYGNEIFNVACIHCHKPIKVVAGRKVFIASVDKSDNKDYDFSTEAMKD
jgi:hypothetical protein